MMQISGDRGARVRATRLHAQWLRGTSILSAERFLLSARLTTCRFCVRNVGLAVTLILCAECHH